MADATKVMLWPSEVHYARFRAVCDDDQPVAYADFVAKIRANLASRGIDEAEYTKVDPDPDKLAVWCRLHCGRVNADARARYVAVHALLN